MLRYLPRAVFIAALLVVVPPLVAQAAAPVVSNVRVQPRTDGSRLVDFLYDLSDDDGDAMAVAVQFSHDGGAHWTAPGWSLTGDVGEGVQPGTDRVIVWDAGADFPDEPSLQYQVRVVASDAGVIHTTHSPANYWIMEWGDPDWTNPNTVEKIAKGDVSVLGMYSLWSHPVYETLDIVNEIKAINPDAVLLGYFLAKTNMLEWEFAPAGSFRNELFLRTRPYWSMTTAGDTLMNWPGQVVLDILDPDCRQAIVSTLAEFQNLTNNPLDGILWDYYDTSIWIHPDVAPSVEGYPDMDHDGIGMDSDPDEVVAYRAACDSLILLTRDLLGDDFIQVFNGTRAQIDPQFAALGDGMYYEIFPTQVFPDPDMAHALDPDYSKSLFHAVNWPRADNGGPYIVLGNYWRNIYWDQNNSPQPIIWGDLFRAVALLTDVYSTWLTSTNHRYSWPDLEINLGDPVGATVIDGDHLWREFQHGRVDLVLDTGAYPNPLSFEIHLNGVLVQAFDLPFHYP